MFYKTPIYRILTHGLLLLWGWVIFNSIINQHAHELSDGRIIIHAHPYEKSSNPKKPYPAHHHKSIELSLLAFHNYIPLDSIFYKFSPPCSLYQPALPLLFCVSGYDNQPLDLLFLRGPPAKV